jgi:hypothetical protein
MLANLVGILERGAFPDAEWTGKPSERNAVCDMYWISLTHPCAKRYARDSSDWRISRRTVRTVALTSFKALVVVRILIGFTVFRSVREQSESRVILIVQWKLMTYEHFASHLVRVTATALAQQHTLVLSGCTQQSANSVPCIFRTSLGDSDFRFRVWQRQLIR